MFKCIYVYMKSSIELISYFHGSMFDHNIIVFLFNLDLFIFFNSISYLYRNVIISHNIIINIEWIISKYLIWAFSLPFPIHRLSWLSVLDINHCRNKVNWLLLLIYFVMKKEFCVYWNTGRIRHSTYSIFFWFVRINWTPYLA